LCSAVVLTASGSTAVSPAPSSSRRLGPCRGRCRPPRPRCRHPRHGGSCRTPNSGVSRTCRGRRSAQSFPLPLSWPWVVGARRPPPPAHSPKPGGYHVDVGRRLHWRRAGSNLSGLAAPSPSTPARPHGGRVGRPAEEPRARPRRRRRHGGSHPRCRALTDVPLATLAAVLIFVATRIFRGRDLLHICTSPCGSSLRPGDPGRRRVVRRRTGHRCRRRARHPEPHRRSGPARDLRARPQSRTPPDGRTSGIPNNDACRRARGGGLLLRRSLYFAKRRLFRLRLHAPSLPPRRRTPSRSSTAVAMGDIDFTGARGPDAGARRAREHPRHRGRKPGAVASAPQNLSRSGILERIGAHHLFPSVGRSRTGARATSAADLRLALRQGPGDSLVI